ncbi:MAG: hydrogenase maturation protease [Myxococcota bacterium]
MLTIIGCGNLNRSDDGVGVVVAQRLIRRFERHPVPGVRAFDCGTGGMDVMFRARGSDALLVLDAAVSGVEAGTIYDVPGDALAEDHDPTFSLHDFRWQHALGAGRRIFRDAFPAEVKVWLVEAETTALGLELTAPVAAAADRLYERALGYAADYAARRHEGRAPTYVELHQGSLRIGAEAYRRYFESREAALFMVRDDRLHLIPVAPMSGGVLLKQRTAAGDRVVDAGEFLRAQGWDDQGAHRCPAAWDSELGALVIDPPTAAPAPPPPPGD